MSFTLSRMLWKICVGLDAVGPGQQLQLERADGVRRRIAAAEAALPPPKAITESWMPCT